MYDNDFGEDILDLRDLLIREEEILDDEVPPSDEEWAFIGHMKELRAETTSDLQSIADEDGTMILETHMSEYAEEYATSVTGVDTDQWPLNHIDWEEAAEDLTVDMSEVNVSGYVYYVKGF